MESLRKEDIHTIDDIYALPDGERAELIDGQIYYMAPPSTRHQRLLNYINTEINMYIRACFKNHSRHLHAPLCVIFAPDSVAVARYDSFIWHKSPTNCDAHLTENIFETRPRKNNGKCEVFPALFAVFLNEDDINYVEPDISVICEISNLDEKGCHGAPDWIIEIVSPGSKPMDYMTKLFKYKAAKVKEYWIVDPGKEMTTVPRI